MTSACAHVVLTLLLIVPVAAERSLKITSSATEMRELLALASSCTKATDGDMRDQLGLLNAMKGLCRERVGCDNDLDDVRVNADADVQACITQGDVHFTGLKPTQGSKQVDQQEACNNLDSKVSQTISLGGSDGGIVTVATTNTVDFSEEIDIEVGIPEEFAVTSKTMFGFSSSRTQAQQDTSSRSFSNSIQVDIPSKSCVCGKEDISTLVYDSTFTVNVCVTGAFRCQYSSRCNGHYYWYISMHHLTTEQTCYTINGHARSNQDISGHARVDPGKCPSAIE